MTFLEAAIEILKRERQPLHYKKLTQLAIERKLLTVIGRTPELTMQQRLNDALKKHDPALLLTREKPGVYGLRYYPSPEPRAPKSSAEPKEAPAAPQASAGAPEATGEAGDDKKRRRRRGGRGRWREGQEDAAATVDAAAIARRGPAPQGSPGENVRQQETASTEAEAQGMGEGGSALPQLAFVEAATLTPAPELQEEAAQGHAAGDEMEEGVAEETPALAEEIPTRLEHWTAAPDEMEGGSEMQGRDATTAPLPEVAAPAAEPRRKARHEPSRTMSERRTEPAPRPAEARPEAPRPESAPYRGSPVDAVVDVLRGGDGKPLHIRQIVDLAIKRRLLRGSPPELWRSISLALLADQRVREAAGLRPRVRATGGGHYMLSERKLDQELLEQERSLTAAVARLSTASHASLRRRLARMAPPAFESFARLLLERMGIVDLEFIKRGEGVAYYGGQRQGDGQRRKVLIALRPGEGEFGRRAVAELRAGLKARGFESGLLLAAGRASADVAAELGHGGPLEVRDGEGLVTVCVRYDLGILRRAVTVELLDIDLLGELES